MQTALRHEHVDSGPAREAGSDFSGVPMHVFVSMGHQIAMKQQSTVPRIDSSVVSTSKLVRGLHRLENSSWPDRLSALLATPARAVVGPPDREALLRGRALGHAAHPMLAMMPLGMWTAVTALDLVGGRAAQPGAQRLNLLGLAAIAPTVATGLAEWRTTEGAARRVGAVHACTNTVAAALMTLSYVSRRQHHHGRAIAAAGVGNAAAAFGGFLGGHLSVARKIGSRDPSFADR